MKTPIFILLTLFCQVSFAQRWQGRLIDIGFKILEPEENRYYKLPNTIQVKLRATNYGPDTMCIGDTIYYGFNVGSHARRLLIYRLNNQLLPGQSVLIEDTLAFKDRPSPPWAYNYGWTLFEIYGCFAWNSNNEPCKFINPDYDPREGRDSNNFDTVKLYYTNAQSSVEQIQADIQLYPSPFAEAFTLTSSLDMLHIDIRDMAGRIVYSRPAGRRRSMLVEPETLTDGVYLLEVIDISGIKQSFKIIKSHD